MKKDLWVSFFPEESIYLKDTKKFIIGLNQLSLEMLNLIYVAYLNIRSVFSIYFTINSLEMFW